MCKHAGLYIAYGSNMNIEQMARRCPTAKVVSSGWLEGYGLRFKGGSYGSVATVEPSPDDLVPIPYLGAQTARRGEFRPLRGLSSSVSQRDTSR